MQKQVIRISKDVREAHKRLIAINDTVPKELPADIEIKTTSVSIGDLDESPYRIEHIKLGWPGYRVEIHIRKHEDGKRAIHDIVIRRSDRKAQNTYDYNQLANDFKIDSWKS